MNSLGRNIQPGEIVMVLAGLLPEGHPDGRFVCDKGDGLRADTANANIYGHWADGVRGTITGHMIDPEATATYQAEAYVALTPDQRAQLLAELDGDESGLYAAVQASDGRLLPTPGLVELLNEIAAGFPEGSDWAALAREAATRMLLAAN